MSETSAACPTAPYVSFASKVKDVSKVADECKQILNALIAAHDQYVLAFKTQERQLLELLSRLQGLAEGLQLVDGVLPIADVAVDAPAPLASSPTGEVAGPTTPDAELLLAAGLVPVETRQKLPLVPAPPVHGDGGGSDKAHQQSTEVGGTDHAQSDGSESGQSSPRPTDEKKELFQTIKARYPSFAKVFKPAKLADALNKSLTARHLPRSLLLAISNAYLDLRDRLTEVLHDDEGGRSVLLAKGRDLMNQLQELDKHLEVYPTSADQPPRSAFQEIRDGLWAFIQAATNGAYREVSPKEYRNIGEWVRLEGYMPEDKYIESRPTKSSIAKDSVVKTLRPGYVLMSADGTKVERVIVKAVVLLSAGNAP